jgi:hypothetical protein
MSMFGPKQNKGLWLALFFGLGTFVMVAFVIFQTLVPVNVGTYGNIEVSTDPVEAGSLQQYTAKDCDEGQYQSVDIRQTLVSKSTPPEVTLPVAGRYVTSKLLCRNIIVIPQETPQGQYQIQISVSYKVNAFRTEDRVYFSKPFVITNKDTKFNILEAPEQEQFQATPGGSVNDTENPENLSPADNSSATPTTPLQPVTPSQPNTPITPVIPQGPVQRTVNELLNGVNNGVNEIVDPVLCNPLLRLSC